MVNPAVITDENVCEMCIRDRVQEVLRVQIAAYYQRGTTLVSAYLLIFGTNIRAGLIQALVFLAVVIVNVELGAFGVNPPLPGGQDVLDRCV